jgi:membrane dipeptidase
MHYIIDAHEDLATNMMTFQRDYRRSVAETRKLEAGTQITVLNEDTLIGWPEYQKGQIAVICGTLFASPRQYQLGGWDKTSYENASEARAIYRKQMDLYRELCDSSPDMFRLISSRGDLKQVLGPWEDEAADYPGCTHPVGIIPLMEGAEGLDDPAEIEDWWEAGVRIVGPVWAGTRFCGGTKQPGRFTPEGRQLLEHMSGSGFILDISHMSPDSALEALDLYQGKLIASHGNALSMVKGASSPRHFTDETILRLAERGGVVGVVPFNRFLVNGWTPIQSRDLAPLELVIAQIDHICQLTGSAAHTGIGSDFDGGFGLQSTPPEIDTIADLQKIDALLAGRGYRDADIAAILSLNWKRFLETALPE